MLLLSPTGRREIPGARQRPIICNKVHITLISSIHLSSSRSPIPFDLHICPNICICPKSYAADLMLDNLCPHCSTLYVSLRVMLYRAVFYYDVRIERCHTNVPYFVLPQFCPVFTYHKTCAPLLCPYQRQRKSMSSYYV